MYKERARAGCIGIQGIGLRECFSLSSDVGDDPPPFTLILNNTDLNLDHRSLKGLCPLWVEGGRLGNYKLSV